MKEILARLGAKENRFRLIVWGICELFSLFSAGVAFVRIGITDGLLGIGVGLLLLLPFLLERIFSVRMETGWFLFIEFYLLAAMAGRLWSLYYLLEHWDKLLHFCGGVIFALLGSYLPVLLNPRNRNDYRLRLFFGFFFSVAIAGLWELYEFGADQLLGMDMQRDTIVSSLHSYSLGDAPGVVGHIDRIESVVVNGKVLCEGGYLDIGLFDTIGDMAIESLGALVLAVAGLCDRGRHPAFRRVTAAEAGAGTALTE